MAIFTLCKHSIQKICRNDAISQSQERSWKDTMAHTWAIILLTFDHRQPHMAALACMPLFAVVDEAANTSSHENNMLVHF